MDSSQPYHAGDQSGYLSSKVMIVGVSLVVTGSVIGAFGMGMSGTAMIRSIRRWLLAQQPTKDVASQIATQKADKVRTVGASRNGAWKRETATTSPAR